MKDTPYSIALYISTMIFSSLSCNQITGVHDFKFGEVSTDSATDTSSHTTDTNSSNTDTDTHTNLITDTNTNTDSSTTEKPNPGLDTSTDTNTDTNTDTSTASCDSSVVNHFECNGYGNVVSFNACGKMIDVVEVCSSPKTCDAGVCACEPGWTGNACDVPIIYVDGHIASDSSHTGRSWPQAFSHLNEALILANSFDNCEIWVTKGYYVPGTTRTDTFQLPPGALLYGGFMGTEKQRAARNFKTNETILSGDINADDGQDFENNDENAYHVVTAGDNTLLDGFTISGGNANDSGTDTIYNRGGGLYCSNVTTEIANCTFLNNFAGEGGGVYSEIAHVKIINSTFTKNEASYNGGGAYCTGTIEKIGAIKVTNSVFYENVAKSGAGVFFSLLESATIEGCLFNKNSSTNQGGAITVAVILNAEVLGCTFVANSAQTSAGILNTIALQETAYTCIPSNIINCIFWGNIATGYSPGHEQIKNCPTSTPISYSLIEGGCDSVENAACGEGNLNEPPRFVNEASGDYHLTKESPCVDAGDDNAVGQDINDFDGDGNTGESIPWDLDGKPRQSDGNGDSSSTVDMGAYEYVP